jgi:hypothetical protein
MILEIVSPEASLFKGETTDIRTQVLMVVFKLNNHAPIVFLQSDQYYSRKFRVLKRTAGIVQ